MTESCSTHLFEHGFRLIDVQEWMLVDIKCPCEYVALPYVWGERDPTRFRTETANLAFLMQPNAERVCWETRQETAGQHYRGYGALPQVREEISWADVLCTIQDDSAEKMRLIHSINHIFEGAALTLIALAGSNADAGIWGVRGQRHLPSETSHWIAAEERYLNICCVRDWSLIQQKQESF